MVVNISKIKDFEHSKAELLNIFHCLNCYRKFVNKTICNFCYKPLIKLKKK